MLLNTKNHQCSPCAHPHAHGEWPLRKPQRRSRLRQATRSRTARHGTTAAASSASWQRRSWCTRPAKAARRQPGSSQQLHFRAAACSRRTHACAAPYDWPGRVRQRRRGAAHWRRRGTLRRAARWTPLRAAARRQRRRARRARAGYASWQAAQLCTRTGRTGACRLSRAHGEPPSCRRRSTCASGARHRVSRTLAAGAARERCSVAHMRSACPGACGGGRWAHAQGRKGVFEERRAWRRRAAEGMLQGTRGRHGTAKSGANRRPSSRGASRASAAGRKRARGGRAGGGYAAGGGLAGGVHAVGGSRLGQPW